MIKLQALNPCHELIVRQTNAPLGCTASANQQSCTSDEPLCIQADNLHDYAAKQQGYGLATNFSKLAHIFSRCIPS